MLHHSLLLSSSSGQTANQRNPLCMFLYGSVVYVLIDAPALPATGGWGAAVRCRSR